MKNKRNVKVYPNKKAYEIAKQVQHDYGLNGKQFNACYKDIDSRLKRKKPLSFF